VLSLPARLGGQVELHPIRLTDSLLRLPAVRQYQIAAQAGALRVKVVLRGLDGGDALRDIRWIVQSELDQIGAAVKSLSIEPVDQIERRGPAAKERFVSNTG
jgi:hypothetical protein